jgi:hypothetical protein
MTPGSPEVRQPRRPKASSADHWGALTCVNDRRRPPCSEFARSATTGPAIGHGRVARCGRSGTWAVEGRRRGQLAQRLVADGETVLDVPTKLSTRTKRYIVRRVLAALPQTARCLLVGASTMFGRSWSTRARPRRRRGKSNCVTQPLETHGPSGNGQVGRGVAAQRRAVQFGENGHW